MKWINCDTYYMVSRDMIHESTDEFGRKSRTVPTPNN